MYTFCVRNVDLPLGCLWKEFDIMVCPIILYESEIWAYENTDFIDKVHLKYLEMTIRIRNSTQIVFVYEFYREPLSIKISKRMMTFWHKTLKRAETLRLSHALLNLISLDRSISNTLCGWLNKVENILDRFGLSEVFNKPQDFNTSWVTSKIEITMKDHVFQTLNSRLWSSSKGH